MSDALRFILPFTYLRASRLRDMPSWASMLGYEWIPHLLLIAIFAGLSPLMVPAAFLGAYIAFIAIYEVGYLLNDVKSVRHEANPRRRIPDFDPSNGLLALWIGSRVAFFVGFTFALGLEGDWVWWGFHAALALIFALHNNLRFEPLRIATFMGLALGRAFAPILPWLSDEVLAALMAPILLNYVFFRALGYLDGKRFLRLPERRSGRFRIGFYVVLLPVSALLSLLTWSMLPIVVTSWYIAFWIGISMLKRITGRRDRVLHADEEAETKDGE